MIKWKRDSQTGLLLVDIKPLFFLLDMFGFTFGAVSLKWFILMRTMFFNDYALIKHEEHHIKRQRVIGLRAYVWKHYTDDSFRFQEEVVAHVIEDWYRLPPSVSPFDTSLRPRHFEYICYYVVNKYNIPIEHIPESILGECEVVWSLLKKGKL